MIEEEVRRVRGTVTVVSADNLASQLVGSYKALNAAFWKCRYCMATDEEMQRKVSLRTYLLALHSDSCFSVGQTSLLDITMFTFL